MGKFGRTTRVSGSTATPQVVVKVGKRGVRGDVKIQDILFNNISATAGLILNYDARLGSAAFFITSLAYPYTGPACMSCLILPIFLSKVPLSLSRVRTCNRYKLRVQILASRVLTTSFNVLVVLLHGYC